MRQVFYLLLALLVIRLFLPDVGERLESALVAFLELAEAVFSGAIA